MRDLFDLVMFIIVAFITVSLIYAVVVKLAWLWIPLLLYAFIKERRIAVVLAILLL